MLPQSVRPFSTVTASGLNKSPSWCAGVWPAQGQSAYAYDCYGHDEPGLQFYSALQGSGGNFTWNVTLPVDRSPTENQSNLYVAVWFGMTLTDPHAWLGQCFLELQFYPDSSWYAPGSASKNSTVFGKWVGEAVAWQIESRTGYEDPCYISPLYTNGVHGPNFFNMTQGDRVQVNMTGWSTSPYGENISVRDLTNGNRTLVNLFNNTGRYENLYNRFNNYTLGTPNYPLNPAYVANDFENGLQWTPGGEYPVVFAFEVGHAGNPAWPSNNAYGGCSPGPPSFSKVYPGIPCPSYDPGSWANDTAAPWRIAAPEYRVAGSVDHPAQVAFTQDFGGFGAVTALSEGACSRSAGTAWCSYPWYSYSCAAQAFEFGATDYPGVSDDFGKFFEYSQQSETNALGLGYYPPTNFSIPTCGGPAYSVSLSGMTYSNPIYFLSAPAYTATNFTGLGAGSYSVRAFGTQGSQFSYWVTSGGVRVDDLDGALTTLHVSGNGSLQAVFASSVATTDVTFATTSATGYIGVLPDMLYAPVPLGTFSNGQSVNLTSGIDALQAYPPASYNFSRWSVSGIGAHLSAAFFPVTLLVITGASPSVTVTAAFVASSSTELLNLSVLSGRGTVTLGTRTVTQNGGALFSLPVGTYRLNATPSPGYTFGGWHYSGGVMTDFLPHTLYTLEYGSGSCCKLLALFDVVLNASSNSTGGYVSVDGGPPDSQVSATIVTGSYVSLQADTLGGYNFTGWASSNTSAIWVVHPREAATLALVNASGGLAAGFRAVSTVYSVTFATFGDQSAILEFNFALYSNGTTNTSVASGIYPFSALPGPYTAEISIRSSTVGIKATPSTLNVTGTGTVTVYFGPVSVPVTFVSVGGPTVVGTVGSTNLTTDGTVMMAAGRSYALTAKTSGGPAAFDGWEATLGAYLANPRVSSTSLFVRGAATVYALAVPWSVVGPSASPANVLLGHPVRLNVTFSGAAVVSYQWNGLPPGCTSASSAAINCIPSATGTYLVSVTVTDTMAASYTSPSVTVVVSVGPAFTSVVTMPALIDVGGTVAVSWAASGGFPPYSFSVSAPAAARCSTALPGATSVSCAPLNAGSYTVVLDLTDSQGLQASAFATLQVNPALQILSFVALPSDVTVGVAATLSVTAQGGTSPLFYSYSGLPPGCQSVNFPLINCRPSSNGTFPVSVTVTDDIGGSIQDFLNLTVNPLPRIDTYQVAPASVSVGSTTAFTVVASGGTEPYSYRYAGLPRGCSSDNISILVCVPQQSGTFTIQVTVSDAFGVPAEGNATLTVVGTSSPGIFPGTILVSLSVAAVASGVAFSLVYLWRHRRMRTPGAEDATSPLKPGGPGSSDNLSGDPR